MSLSITPSRLQPLQLKNLDSENTNTDHSSSDATNTSRAFDTPGNDNSLKNGGDSLLFQEEAKMQRSDVIGFSDLLIQGTKSLITPLEALTQQEAKLEEQLANTSTFIDKIKLIVQLHSVRYELRQEALKALEKFMVSEQSPASFEQDSSSVTALQGNKPRDYIGADELSVDELRALSVDPSATAEVSASAQYFLDNPNFLNAVMMAGYHLAPTTSIDGPELLDNSISLADIQASRLQAGNVPNQIEQNVSVPGGSYTVPDKDNNGVVLSTANNPGKGQQLFNSQQEAVEQAIKTSKSVEFVNQNGETMSVAITPLVNRGGAGYEVSLNRGEVVFRVDSEWSTDDTIAGIANIIDWGSTFGAEQSLSSFPPSVLFASEKHSVDPNADADAPANSTGPAAAVTASREMIFFGVENLNRVIYNHEQGHVVGHELSTSDAHHPIPDGWLDVVKEAFDSGISPVSRYAHVNLAESFAESVAAYANARNNGPEALAQFKAAYPYRSAFLEEHVFTRQPG